MPPRMHCKGKFQHLSEILQIRSDKFKMTRGIPVDSPVNPAAFICSHIVDDLENGNIMERIWLPQWRIITGFF